jgi:hypothetical protein
MGTKSHNTLTIVCLNLVFLGVGCATGGRDQAVSASQELYQRRRANANVHTLVKSGTAEALPRSGPPTSANVPIEQTSFEAASPNASESPEAVSVKSAVSEPAESTLPTSVSMTSQATGGLGASNYSLSISAPHCY